MIQDNRTKVKILVHKISFLMPHQEVFPELIDVAKELTDSEDDLYLQGAKDALIMLLESLTQKGH